MRKLSSPTPWGSFIDCCRAGRVIFVEQRLSIPYARHGVLAELRDRLQVIEEEYGEAISVTVRGTREVLGQLAARLSSG